VQNPSHRIQAIFLNKAVVDDAVTVQILKRADGIPVEIIDDEKAESLRRELSLSKGKRFLYLAHFPGNPVKPCPATAPPYLCCRYTVINQILQCPMDCTYCILQGYLDTPVVTLYTNLDTIFRNVHQTLSGQPGRLFRFGTGELGDSLVLDDLAELSGKYADYFSKISNAVIELKTKTAQIDGLMGLTPRHTIISWSLNPQSIINSEECHTAPLAERLNAARRCQDAGYPVGFHFDPILFFPGWEKEYDTVVRLLFDTLDGSRIAWISLGTLRFPPSLKAIIQERFPGSRIVYEEMIRGLDGKMRYPRPVRTELVRTIARSIKTRFKEVFVYLCMEHPSVWDAALGRHPESNAELDFWFAQNLFRRFPEMAISEPRREDYRDDETPRNTE
jgi:spore photoproduct lyase